MDLLVIQQVWAVVMFFLGSFILSTCSKWEKKDQAILKESKSYGRRKSDLVKPRTFRGGRHDPAGCRPVFGRHNSFMVYV